MGSGGVGVVVRGAVESDLAAIVEIEESTFSRPWGREAFADALKRPEAELLVATSGGAVAGYAVLHAGAGEAELANLAVGAGFREGGVGRALLAGAAESLSNRGVARLLLAVRASNSRAIGLYRRFGFAEIGTHRSYYRDPSEDARVLVLELPGPSKSTA